MSTSIAAMEALSGATVLGVVVFAAVAPVEKTRSEYVNTS